MTFACEYWARSNMDPDLKEIFVNSCTGTVSEMLYMLGGAILITDERLQKLVFVT